MAREVGVGVSSNITGLSMKLLALIGAVILVSSCSPRIPPAPPLTQLQIRELQTRTFDDKDEMLVQKAVINLLQDEGYIVKNAQSDLGLIVAEKQEPIAEVESETSPFLIGLAAAVVVAAVVIAATTSSSKSSSRDRDRKDSERDRNRNNDPQNNTPPPKPVATMTEISVNITTREKNSVVRFSAQRSVLADNGGKISVEQVLDAPFYQNLFSKLDKALFIERAGF